MKSSVSSAANTLLCQLSDPEPDYRPLPFWSWNDKLDPDELRRQIHLMKQSGVGGYFMHARSGLKTEYLSPDWFDCIRTGIDAGDAEGLQPWVYDEEGWPSGFAGGKVNARGGWTYARGLRLRFLDDPAEAVQDDTLLGVYPLPQGSAAPYAECTQSACPYYIDILNKEVVRVFLETTHEEYARRFVLDNTAGLRGFFTDEPRLSEGPVPWSPILPDEFKARYGYDILPVLPALYLPYGDYRAVRHDFWALVNELFVHAYMEQIFHWCEAHNCRLTGHMMMEESLYSQMTGTGGVMPFYEYMHQPGVDSLRRAINDPRIPKQVGSVAEQLGKPHVLSESFAMSGWDMRFNEMQWIAGWQFVNGVNRICQHLQGYTLAGMRKRDYPPSLFYQQSWYGEYHRFNDSLARLGKLLSTGKKKVDVLLIHPMHSAWVSYDGTNNDELQQLDAQFVRACELLGGAHIDYHLGDETLLARHGSLNADGTLQVGQCRYTAVVVPDCLTLDRRTAELLAGFAEAALQNNYVMPNVDESGVMEIKEGRHPVIEQMLKGSLFVPNDTMLDEDENRMLLITGPNMAGKSTYMRQNALIALMAQIGSFVPAASCHVGVVDAIFTRIGASDDLAAGQSTFMVEMTEVAEILKNATAKSLVVLDEIGRGTSTFDGMSIARAVVEHIADPAKGLGCKTLFATHYHELTELEGTVEGVKNYNIAVKKRGEDITFLRRIVRGPADDSYGIEVAKLAGLPGSVTRRAHEVLRTLEASAPKNKVEQMDFDALQEYNSPAVPSEMMEKLEAVDVETLTPIEALNFLYELKKTLKGSLNG